MCLNLDTGSTDKPHSSRNRCPLGLLYSGEGAGARKGKGKAMNKTKIDWCDSTWNPVTGCFHGCEYCYARGIAKRFGGANDGETSYEGEALWTFEGEENGQNHVLDYPYKWYSDDGNTERNAPYPFYFDPTFHRYRLNDYTGKKGRNIFVCSMADLFGDWVPDEWIKEVFSACEKAPQHNYLFLTKNPARYAKLHEKGILPEKENMWYGSTVTNPDTLAFYGEGGFKTFISVEPLLRPFTHLFNIIDIDWVIVGAETGRRKDKVIPKREWIEDIVNKCKKQNIPLFMKSSLADIWGEPLIQEFPKGLDREAMK